MILEKGYIGDDGFNVILGVLFAFTLPVLAGAAGATGAVTDCAYNAHPSRQTPSRAAASSIEIQEI